MNDRPKIGDRVRFRRRVYVVTKVDRDTATLANDDRTEITAATWRSDELQPAPARKP